MNIIGKAPTFSDFKQYLPASHTEIVHDLYIDGIVSPRMHDIWLYWANNTNQAYATIARQFGLSSSYIGAALLKTARRVLRRHESNLKLGMSGPRTQNLERKILYGGFMTI